MQPKNQTPLLAINFTFTFFTTDHSVETFPAPGGGPILLLLLNIMEGFLTLQQKEAAAAAAKQSSGNDTQAPVSKPGYDNITYHRLVEVGGEEWS